MHDAKRSSLDVFATKLKCRKREVGSCGTRPCAGQKSIVKPAAERANGEFLGSFVLHERFRQCRGGLCVTEAKQEVLPAMTAGANEDHCKEMGSAVARWLSAASAHRCGGSVRARLQWHY